MGVTPQARVTNAEENMGPKEYKQRTLRRLRTVLTHARLKLGAARRHYESDLDSKVSFCSIISVGGFVYVDRPTHALTKAERQETKRLDENITEASRKILPRSEGPYCVPLATDMVVHTVRDGVSTSASTGLVMKVPTALRAAQPSATTDGEA